MSEPVSAVLDRGIDRVRRGSPSSVDLIHDRDDHDPLLSGYSWFLVLELREGRPQAGVDSSGLEADAWTVDVRDGRPVRVGIRAGSERARLYALYHIADCLTAGKPPSVWAMSRRPTLLRRYAQVRAGNMFRPHFRPDLFDRDIAELPGLGMNGVILTCIAPTGTPVAQTIPFALITDGVTVDRFTLPAFRAMLDRIKSYGLDIFLQHQAFVPPPFTVEDAHDHYRGVRELPGFDEAIVKSSRALAESIFTHLPQVDGLLFHSVECGWLWGDAAAIFPCKDDGAGERSFEAYLTGLTDACTAFGKELFFWAHVSGISAKQIRLVHRVLARFPAVVVAEDHAHENDCWPHAPVLGHLPEDLRAEIAGRRFGISIVTTDGEYFGAGALPTAFPDPHILAARTAVMLGAELAWVRLNALSATPLGTLDDINAIHVIAVSEQWWDSPRATSQLWHEWCARRFGVTAAPAVVSALQKSGTIITRGLSAGGIPLIDHSGLPVSVWNPRSTNRAWALFARPGELLVDKTYDDLEGQDFRPWQVGARGVELESFLQQSREAESAAREALREIESVRTALAPEDSAYLSGCFEDALLVIEAVRLTAVAARASAVWLRDGRDASRRELEAACVAMEACADRIVAERGNDFCRLHFFFKTVLHGREYSGYGVPTGLRAIADMYLTEGERT
jgi:hypothetical protein